MSWIAMVDKTRAHFCADGLVRLSSSPQKLDAPLNEPMPFGSILLETRVSPYDRPQLLVGYRSSYKEGTQMTFQALPGGGIVLVMSRENEAFHAAINLDTGGRTDTLRVTYSWDMRAKRGRLAVELPGKIRIATRELTNPMPLSLEAVRELSMNSDQCVFAPDVAFLAVSNRIEPVGPMPSLTPTTPVMTEHGYRPVGGVRRGDLVETLDRGLVPVLANFHRTVPAAGLFAPVRLRRPYFGLKQDIMVSPAQHLVIGGSRVEYLFGSENVLVPSGHLLHGNAAMPYSGNLLITYCQLMMPDHEAILCAGTYLESLNIGRIRRKRDVHNASLFCRISRSHLPEHSLTAFPVLREFEALTLAAQRAAA
ncbi:Hint domain-containing protein [Pseudopelagicola sp. nBUS_19]|uniref:Hint domain-containing protein n=1 Tax=unclassified Pseudopelagicola TaxID=2649563 RepID=UPI003EBA9BEB